MSETLRWILIAFSVALLIGIYLWGRRSGGHAAVSDDASMRRPEPKAQLRDSGGHDDFADEVQPLEEFGSSENFAVDSSATTEDVASGVVRHEQQASDDDSYEPEEARGPRAGDYPNGEYSSGNYARNELADRHARRGRIEPTFSEAGPTEELPVHEAPQEQTQNLAEAPTLSMSSTPQPRRIERRKIIALRLSAGPQRFDGARLRAAIEAESLQHGKYNVFHRLHEDGASIFSVASMIEPGTFDLEKMAGAQFPGVTLFAQLPGPVAGMHALNELVACARSLHQTLGGTLQDERGVPLTVHRIERLRQDVRDFERPHAGAMLTDAGSTFRPASH
jgi:FtsZ-interacting cell division protein ZipA